MSLRDAFDVFVFCFADTVRGEHAGLEVTVALAAEDLQVILVTNQIITASPHGRLALSAPLPRFQLPR